MNRESDKWVEPAIKTILIVSAICAVIGIGVVAHFVLKFW